MHVAVVTFAFLLWPISAERGHASQGVIAFDEVTTFNEASLKGCRKEGTCDLYTMHNVTIPSYVQAADFAQKLSYIRETQLPDKLTTREDVIIENSMRYALLAYGRNDAKGLVYHALRNTNDLVALELQFKSLRHVKGEVDDTAHLVAYLIRGEAPARGFGVVLAYKGSTNSVDWKVNMDSKSVLLFPDMPDEKTNYVHRGFLGHKQRLDERMKKAPMAPLKDSLKLWSIETSAENFHDFLLEATWNWCICVGHSMGGALAAISALDLAIHTKQLREKVPLGVPIPAVYAVGVASAIPGSEGFSESMDGYVKPHGGLRIANYGDVVTFLGYGKMSFRRSKRTVAGYEWTLHSSVFSRTFKKLKTHIQYDIDNGRGKLTRYLFSSMGQTMKSNSNQIGGLSLSTLFEED